MKGAVAKRKAAMGYERHPAACGNCKHFRRNHLNLPEGAPFRPGTCTYGSFVTFQSAVCDAWEGINGDQLDQEGSKP